jgi:hypothetical protein
MRVISKSKKQPAGRHAFSACNGSRNNSSRARRPHVFTVKQITLFFSFFRWYVYPAAVFDGDASFQELVADDVGGAVVPGYPGLLAVAEHDVHLKSGKYKERPKEGRQEKKSKVNDDS